MISTDENRIVRFLERGEVLEESGCLLWQGKVRDDGYVQSSLWPLSEQDYVHRISYRLFVGEIPDGMQIDHLCRIRHCFNPDHLEAVTHQENVSRSSVGRRKGWRKTTCKRGHNLSGDNLMPMGNSGYFKCVECYKIRKR